MKKKIFGGIAILAIVAMAAFNLNLNVENGDSPLSLANVEILAFGESKCYTSSDPEKNTGNCRRKVDNTGDVCVTGSGKVDCNGNSN